MKTSEVRGETRDDANDLIDRYGTVTKELLRLGHDEYAKAIRDDNACPCQGCVASRTLTMALAGVLVASVGSPERAGILHAEPRPNERKDPKRSNPEWLRRRAVLDALPEVTACMLTNLRGSAAKFAKDFSTIHAAYERANGGDEDVKVDIDTESEAKLRKAVKALKPGPHRKAAESILELIDQARASGDGAVPKSAVIDALAGAGAIESKKALTSDEVDTILKAAGLTRDNPDVRIIPVDGGFRIATMKDSTASLLLSRADLNIDGKTWRAVDSDVIGTATKGFDTAEIDRQLAEKLKGK